MNIIENKLYFDDIDAVSRLEIPWERLQNRTVLVSGASGMIGSSLIDVLMLKNRRDGLSCRIIAIGRDAQKAQARFNYCAKKDGFEFVPHDINTTVGLNTCKKVDIVLHLASNTHPVAYATDPIGTITTNIIGTNNLLSFAVQNGSERFLFASSCEVYGENRGDVERFDEGYAGYIDCNTLRAGYPESKRCGEALCQAYGRQYGIDVVLPRLSRTYGPTMLKSDTKAISQFILKGVTGENIVLKSAGSQLYSYTYVTDAVSGLLAVLLKGKSGEAYNVADNGSDITLKELATHIAKCAGTKVVFDLPSEAEAAGYSRATKSCLDGAKLRCLGWKARYDVVRGVERTIKALRSMEEMKR